MTRGFQNTPYVWILLKIEGAIAQQNKAYYFVWPSVHKRCFWTWFQNACWNLLSPFSQLPWVQIGKFQCPSSWEFPKFLGTPHIFHPIVILKGGTANQTANHERWVLPLGTVILDCAVQTLSSLYSKTVNLIKIAKEVRQRTAGRAVIAHGKYSSTVEQQNTGYVSNRQSQQTGYTQHWIVHTQQRRRIAELIQIYEYILE